MELDLHVFSTPSAAGPALAEVTYCQKAPDGRGPDAAGEIRMQVGLGNQLEQAGKHTEPSLTPAVNRRAGAADLRTQRPDGQGRCDGERCNGRNRS